LRWSIGYRQARDEGKVNCVRRSIYLPTTKMDLQRLKPHGTCADYVVAKATTHKDSRGRALVVAGEVSKADPPRAREGGRYKRNARFKGWRPEDRRYEG
jgi:hypothetical protein